MLEKTALYLKLAAYVLNIIYEELGRAARTAWVRRRVRWFGPPAPLSRDRNIVIVGASFAGNRVAQLLTSCLPPNSPYKVIVIEPNTHFQFSWVLPRLCVVEGHEHKAFIPYGGNVHDQPAGVLRWARDRVIGVTESSVQLKESGEIIPYDMLVIATGSGVETGLPSRVNATDKRQGMELMRNMQQKIKAANTVVVVGGGAAGVEIATDAQNLYPNKKIILVHSRAAVMNRFGQGLQKTALEGLQSLGVEVILQDRLVQTVPGSGTILLKSGREIQCDLVLDCTGQKPSSGIVSQLSPTSISPSGHLRVKPTLQLADDKLPNVYACGDVADTKTPNPNARSAMRQASIVAENILSVATGGKPRHKYENNWSDGVIKLTLGLTRSVTHYGDGKSELLFPGTETDEALMSAMCWSRMGQKPFEDPYMDAVADSSTIKESV
ncbi:hypothetical protein F5B22DRAFT_587328 [Xylaria bambusicola]|uniref:uncharacterized protein n=1 Tax=Xylaria bambusicola TaxID=326684 RepID=UPI00200859CF|nr:uncharacterized protein F5B22DRAFT_587328 [Xylaria bambusicola]KAI0526732.1 hypothetical protein F5B22DRAFT_587328 [Xylaria bambusicola]